jgi:hypothetical protein
LIPIIEGIGKTKAEGKVALQAFGIVSYDDELGTHHVRANNDGRYLETDLKTSEDGKGLPGGFALGEGRTGSVLRINEKVSGASEPKLRWGHNQREGLWN